MVGVVTVLVCALTFKCRNNIFRVGYDHYVDTGKQAIKTCESLKDAGLSAKDAADVLNSSQPYQRYTVTVFGLLVSVALLYGLRIRIDGSPRVRIES